MNEHNTNAATQAAHRAGRVVVLGSLNVDLFARVQRHPLPGETVLGQGGETRSGGKGANQAVAAALAGANVTMIGCVGSDANAQVALAGLRRAGVDVSGVRVVEGPTGIALITVSADGENSIIVIPGANAALNEIEVSALADLGTGDVCVLQGEVPVEIAAQAAQAAHGRGARIVINLAPVVDYPAEVLRCADPLIVNEHEGLGALELLGGSGTDAGDPRALMVALLAAGVPTVAMTLGGDGALIGAGDSIDAVPADAVPVVDTTGAGDAFAGALAQGLAAGSTLLQSAHRANDFAAHAVQHAGAQDSYPDWRA
ncbi:ribokinase [Gephyromycinifex aptenodytis]|uniref:ribokinase n=1 Tax=Gephyromycinifex aptenodytis TaxID=2716227 RepID=UPI0014474FA3|nr:ribokinase [Gephyromycinifex aptenodytis]